MAFSFNSSLLPTCFSMLLSVSKHLQMGSKRQSCLAARPCGTHIAISSFVWAWLDLAGAGSWGAGGVTAVQIAGRKHSIVLQLRQGAGLT